MTASHAPITELGNVRRAGFDAAYRDNISAIHCPYTDYQLRHVWLQGHTIGRKQRNLDMHSGSHPDLGGRVSA